MFKAIKDYFSIKGRDKQNIEISKIDASEQITARQMLKQATALKQDKKFDEACEKLKEAFNHPSAVDLMIEERLRHQIPPTCPVS